MAAGATRKVKRAAAGRAQAKHAETQPSEAQTPLDMDLQLGTGTKATKAAVGALKTSSIRKKRATRAAAGKTVAGKSAVLKSTAAKPKSKTKPKSKSSTGRRVAKASDADTIAMLNEQNEALREELAHAQSRIQELEALNKTVVNRIDRVIDSLQGLLEKR